MLHQVHQNKMKDLSHISEEVFESIFRQYYPKVVYYSYNYVRDMEKARNIAQDVFYQLWRYKDEVNFNDTSPLPFLLIVAKRLSLNLLRKENCNTAFFAYQKKKYTLHQFDMDALTDSSATALYTQEVKKLYVEGLEKMPQQIRETFLLSRSKNMKYKEIADFLNISQKTVEYRISVALNVLRAVFGEYFPDREGKSGF